VLVSSIQELWRQYIGVTNDMIQEMASNFHPNKRSFGKSWLSCFQRYPQLKSGRGHVIPSGRLTSLDADIVTNVFDRIQHYRERYSIQQQKWTRSGSKWAEDSAKALSLIDMKVRR